MIKLNNIDKYFFKNKANQNQVCKDINLEFEDKGFVVILGSSGSGKTTLLNIISGMDKFDHGSLEFSDEEFTKYNSKKWDLIRNKEIGYIFQNYNLLRDITVYENIEIVLKMNGIVDKDEKDRIIDYLLESVGMKNYENRLVKQLSGGQQQRIGFARALSKNPSLILADEPTGNLDSKTTIELMDILKSISKEKLVIMVTHEQALANYYADRIIEVENGKIVNDKENVNSSNLSIIQEQIIYLKDYEKSEVEMEDISLTKYAKETDPNKKINIDVIDKQDTIYVKVANDGAKRIKYIDKDSEIELKNESSLNNVLEKKSFDFNNTIPKQISEDRSVITLKDSFKLALKKMNILTYGGKMLFLVLALVGVIISVSSGLLSEAYRDENIITDENKNYIKLKTDRMTYEEVMAIEDVEGVEQVMLVYKEVSFRISTPKYFEIENSMIIDAFPIDIMFLDEEKLVYGSMPSEYGIVIDQILADEIIRLNSFRGIKSYEDIIQSSFKLQTSDTDEDISLDNAIYFPITGIAKDNSKSVWMAEELIYSFITPGLMDYQILGEYFNITVGDLPSISDAIMLNTHSHLLDDGNIPYNIGMATGKYDVSGIFDYVKDGYSYKFDNVYLTTSDYLKHEYFEHSYRFKQNYVFYAYSSNADETVNTLNDMGYDATSSYLIDVERSSLFKTEDSSNILLLSIGGIVISAISMYFIMRSSLIARVYEVSIYRSLGASKREIRKMFIVEILLTTTLSSIIGYILTTVLLLRIQAGVGIEIHIVYYTLLSFSVGFVGLYVLNIFFGLIPINMLLQKTPSDIMKKYDL